VTPVGDREGRSRSLTGQFQSFAALPDFPHSGHSPRVCRTKAPTTGCRLMLGLFV
jgi:hypothetical protein